ncbi:hypothetical protein SAMN05444004_106130 [Jannaschia faecimaris]|uniref:DUF6314 domain-containing protein n=1 Tax=Jannaschia faecimaris TaxID=1244108 RepID=A0A1H3QHJ9_9RHOB|nr:DUF6314 family protein [Jannaschia faecimaris]SDZ12611.1 hypothetical protein SAMN05444004_106130 [Jannaschia faecimaris]
MTPPERLAGLLGDWRTMRVIRHRNGPTARFYGISIWTPEGRALRCTEQGTLTQDGTSFEAHRETLWRATPKTLEVAFADGRPFHTIDGPAAHHDCAPDTYVLYYDWRNWPRWTVRWSVTGPRKDYRALTRYLRV